MLLPLARCRCGRRHVGFRSAAVRDHTSQSALPATRSSSIRRRPWCTAFDGPIVRRDGPVEAVGPYESPPNEPAGRHSGRGLNRLHSSAGSSTRMCIMCRPSRPRLGESSCWTGSTTTSVRPRKPSPTRHTPALSPSSSAMSSSATVRPRPVSTAPSIRK